MRQHENQLPVNHTMLEVDPKTGAITLIVKDPRINGSETLKVEVPYEHEAAQKAYELLQSEGIVSKQLDLPSESVFPESEVATSKLLKETAKAKMELIDDSRLKLILGEVEDSKFFQFDLNFAAHTLILGEEGSGKSTLLQNLARQTLAMPGTEVYYFDFKALRNKFALNNQLRPQDILAIVPSELEYLFSHIEATVDHRSRILESEGVQNWQQSQYPMAPIIIFLDEFENNMPASYEYNMLQRTTQLRDLFRQGLQRVGVYIVMASSLSGSTALSMKPHMGRRILLGKATPQAQSVVLGSPVDRHQQDLLETVGRGAVATYDKIRLFQGFKEPSGTEQWTKVCDQVWVKKS